MATPYEAKCPTATRVIRSGATVFGLFALLASGPVACSHEPQSPPPERIILIVVDTLRRDHVSAYPQSLAKTPNIDRIVAGGQVFTNAVSGFHATTMSMASLFTGLTPSIETGEGSASVKWNTFASCGLSRFLDESQDQTCLPATVPTLAEDMKQAGYWTLGVVSNELLYRPSGYDRGFDEWVEVGLSGPGEERNIFESSPLRTAVHVNRDLEQAIAGRPSDRFFLYVHYLDVHDYGLFERKYADNVERFDRHLGAMLDHLEAEGLLEGASVILTSDHGELLNETYPDVESTRHFGNPAFQLVLDIPLIIRPPTQLASDEFIRSQDVRGLIRTIAGLDESPANELDDGELFLSEMFYRSYRDERWKSHWPRAKQKPLLFDLQSDPNEKINLATNPSEEQAEILAAHRVRIDELSSKLATRQSQSGSIDENDIERLRALGYGETLDEAFGLLAEPEGRDTGKSP